MPAEQLLAEEMAGEGASERPSTCASSPDADATTVSLPQMTSPKTEACSVGCLRCQKPFPDACLTPVRDENAAKPGPVCAAEKADKAGGGAILGFRCPPCIMTEETTAACELLGADEREARLCALQYLQPLLVKLRQHPSAKPFLHPVDPIRLRVPDYYRRVKAPMDLDLIKLRLSKGYYALVDELALDVARVWDNACAFNPEGSIVFRFAQECRSFWAEALAATQAAHAQGMLAGGGPARKRKPQIKRDESDGPADEGAPAAAPRRAPKPAKRAPAAADAHADGAAAAAGGDDGASADGACATAAAAKKAGVSAAGGTERPAAGARGLSKGWALELVPESGLGASLEPAAATGQPRVRKAKVRWEPEEISGPQLKCAQPPPQQLAHADAATHAVKKVRRSSGGTRCAVQGGASWAGARLDTRAALGGAGGGYPSFEAYMTPSASGGGGALVQSMPTTLYDVAAALPEINVGDDLEGVAGDLDGLLDDMPLDSILIL